MTLQVSVLGIDGSGKSSLVACLPVILAGEMNVIAGSAGETFWVMGAEEDHLAPDFHPRGFPVSARLAPRFRRLAKQYTSSRRLYPIFKLSQMILQDAAARKLAKRYGASVMVSDGNVLLSAMGRTANYRRPASDGEASAAVPAPRVEDLVAVFANILEGKPLPQESMPRLPRLGKAKWINRFCRLVGMGSVWLPDAVILLDLSPRAALDRIAGRHAKVDRHENERDLAQARGMYLEMLEAYLRFRPQALVCRIPVDNLSPGEVLREALEALRPRIAATCAEQDASRIPLGTTAVKLTGGSVWARVLNARYVFCYLLAKFFDGAWREPLFPFSEMGRAFLKEGYSAGVMQIIYDQAKTPHGWFDGVFLGYALHRAVYDRLQILSRRIEAEIESRLECGRRVSIFTAPSGVAYDLFRPLEAIARRHPERMKQVELTAADLDPHDYLARTLAERAGKTGIAFRFLRGDLTAETFRAQFAETEKFDLALFVGLSSWLPRSPAIQHLTWLRGRLRDDSVLLSDCFTAASYALSGRYVGYKAVYYTPESYRALVDYCGFDGLGAEVESGRDRINHVLVARPRPVSCRNTPLPHEGLRVSSVLEL